jgi:hypothetical protein
MRGYRQREPARPGAEIYEGRGVVEPVASQHHQVIHRVSARLLVVGGDVPGVEVLRTGMGAFVKDPRLHLAMVTYAARARPALVVTARCSSWIGGQHRQTLAPIRHVA